MTLDVISSADHDFRDRSDRVVIIAIGLAVAARVA
jgi:hypothetical protein